MALLPFAGASIIKIGKKILSGVAGSNLFIDQNGKLAGDSTNLHYDSSNVPIISTNPRTGAAGDRDLPSRVYIVSRGQNLVTNGSGLLGSNYNFSGATFDGAQVYAGGGSFLSSALQIIIYTDEFLPIDPNRYYRLNVFAMDGQSGGANYSASNQQYIGIALYDIDHLTILPIHILEFPGSAETTLSHALNPGDATMQLTSVTGWQNAGGGTDYTRNFRWYPYTNSFGFSYPDYQYSRNVSNNYSDYYTNGAWAVGGINAGTKTITFRGGGGWAGPALANGTKVANASDGSSLKYIGTGAGVAVPNAWTQYQGFIGGTDTTRTNGTNLFPWGTAFAQLAFLVNYNLTASNIRFSDIWFSEALDLPPQTNGGNMTVALLPSAASSNQGLRAIVLDASAPTIGSTVSGGGAAVAYVWSNGTAWTVIGK